MMVNSLIFPNTTCQIFLLYIEFSIIQRSKDLNTKSYTGSTYVAKSSYFILTNQNLDFTKGIKIQQVNVTFLFVLICRIFCLLVGHWYRLVRYYKADQKVQCLSLICIDLTHIAVRYHDDKVGDKKWKNTSFSK